MRATLRPLLLLLLVAACGEAPTVPLGPVDASRIDSALLGLWTGPDSTRMLVLPFNDHEYYVEQTAVDDSVRHRLRLRAFTTDVEGVSFWNLRYLAIDDSAVTADSTYAFARLDLVGADSLRYRDVAYAPGRRHFPTSDSLYRYVAAQREIDSLYAGEAIVFRRLR